MQNERETLGQRHKERNDKKEKKSNSKGRRLRVGVWGEVDCWWSLRLNFTADEGLELNQRDLKVKSMWLRGAE